MSASIPGLHHITAIAGDPQRNAEFYVRLLGLRLVKYTVNHDDPETPHLYYGDRRGSPGSNITFFSWRADRTQGEFGAGQASPSAFAIAPESLDYWRRRLQAHEIDFNETQRFQETALGLEDPDGIGIELVADPGAELLSIDPWATSPIDAQHQLRGFHSVTLKVADTDATEAVLREVMNYERLGSNGDRLRLQAPGAGPASIVDLVEIDHPQGQIGIGSVHHVAFNVEDTDKQQELRAALEDFGLEPTDVYDRLYFKSIYCREPGGVLFEFATDTPGFTADQDLDDLGVELVLPDELQGQRTEIEAELPDFDPLSPAES